MGLNEHLSELVEELSAPLPGVTKKRMFGCDAFFANGTIYSLIWKEGRVGLKLLDQEDFDAVLAMPGARPWTPGGKMIMSRWLLVPETFHDDTDALAAWVKKAHAQALQAPKKEARPKKPAKKAALAASKNVRTPAASKKARAPAASKKARASAASKKARAPAASKKARAPAASKKARASATVKTSRASAAAKK